jgi:hypothetical protein
MEGECMFAKKHPEPSGLDRVIDEHINEMLAVNLDSKDYPVLLERLAKLYKLKETDAPKRVSADTVAIVAGNLIGILLILHYERLNVIGSKALSFVMKLR